VSPRLIMDGKSRRKFAKKLRRAGQREIGGVLFGEQLAPNEFKIIDFSVDSVTGSAAHFCRSPEHHNTALEGFFAKTGNDYRRYNYLGEWHSHPRFPVHPSNQDQHSMIELVHGERICGKEICRLAISKAFSILNCIDGIRNNSNCHFRLGKPCRCCQLPRIHCADF